jgi:hypothetical protein
MTDYLEVSDLAILDPGRTAKVANDTAAHQWAKKYGGGKRVRTDLQAHVIKPCANSAWARPNSDDAIGRSPARFHLQESFGKDDICLVGGE